MGMVDRVPRTTSTGLRLAGFALLGMSLLGLAGRLLSYPLNRDENLFVTVASQLGRGGIYRDLGYNHLPNLPYLLGGIDRLTGTGHFLLTGRLLVLASWLVAIVALRLIARRLKAGTTAFLVAALLLVGNVLLLGTPGMLASNNFLPIPVSYLAFYFLLGALDPSRPSARQAFLAGVCVSFAIGLKANYIFLAPFFALATFLAPDTRPIAQRLTAATLPLALGGIVGGLPALIHFALDPSGFVAHTVRYFTELQAAYWHDANGPKVVALKDKVLLAEDIWLSNSSLLALTALAALVAACAIRKGWRGLIDWRVLLVAGLASFGFVVAFVPTPSFPQYFVPPIPYTILLVMVLASLLDQDDRAAATPLLIAVSLLSLAGSASRLGAGIAQFAHPGRWDVFALNREVRSLGAQTGLRPGARVATLTPVMALEGGYTIYPEFAAGQFVYRVAPYIAAADRPFYRTTSRQDLARFLDTNPPDGILVNLSEPLEQDLAHYAAAHGYRAVQGTTKHQTFALYARPN